MTRVYVLGGNGDQTLAKVKVGEYFWGQPILHTGTQKVVGLFIRTRTGITNVQDGDTISEVALRTIASFRLVGEVVINAKEKEARPSKEAFDGRFRAGLED